MSEELETDISSSDDTSNLNSDDGGIFKRTIRTYVIRAGRMTDSENEVMRSCIRFGVFPLNTRLLILQMFLAIQIL